MCADRGCSGKYSILRFSVGTCVMWMGFVRVSTFFFLIFHCLQGKHVLLFMPLCKTDFIN